MKINREIIQDAFQHYTGAYNQKDERVALKIMHTNCVADNCDYLSGQLELTEEEKDLAWLIGMLHDIGRFEQCTATGSFIDSKTNDHAQAGVNFLFEQNGLFQFVNDIDKKTDAEFLRYLRLAIAYHNKFSLPADLTKKEQLFCTIIRDADKLDIFRVSTMNPFAVVHEYDEKTVSNSAVSQAVVDCFQNQSTLDYSLRKYPADIFLGHIAMCFGLALPSSRKLAKEQGYVEKMLDFSFENFKTELEFKKMKQSVLVFLNN